MIENNWFYELRNEYREYYTLNEVLKITQNFDQEFIDINAPYFLKVVEGTGLSGFNATQYPLLNNTEETNEIWYRVVNRFGDEFIFYLTNEELKNKNVYINEHLKDFLIRFFSIYRNTNKKYEYLIKIYNDEMNNLLNTIKSTSRNVSRFNDTPQNEYSNTQNFEDDLHVSNISKGESISEDDGMTKMARIKEIQDSLQNLFNEWVNEFDGLFIEKENVRHEKLFY